jgi:hypothetical protein
VTVSLKKLVLRSSAPEWMSSACHTQEVFVPGCGHQSSALASLIAGKASWQRRRITYFYGTRIRHNP